MNDSPSHARQTLRVLPLPLLLLLLAWPAQARAGDEIGLSADGVTWAPQLALPLFEPAARWVPGDDEIRTFELRNQGPSEACLTVEALSPGGDPVLATDVTVNVRVEGGAWAPLDLDAGPRPVTIAALGTAHAVQVEVRAEFDPASGNATQGRVMPLVLRITLTEDTRAEDGRDAGTSGSTDALPGTGLTASAGLLLVALGLVGAGAAVIARRSPDGDDQGRVAP